MKLLFRYTKAPTRRPLPEPKEIPCERGYVIPFRGKESAATWQLQSWCGNLIKPLFYSPHGREMKYTEVLHPNKRLGGKTLSRTYAEQNLIKAAELVDCRGDLSVYMGKELI